MFSKAIFKQTLSQNWKLWLIFTLVTTAISVAIINTFDPQAMRLAMQAFGADGPPQGMGGGPLGTGTSRFGMLTIPDLMANGFYAMLGLIMPLIYVIVTANALVASKVDRGSMAYTLSTPITRTKVVTTQAIYLTVALFTMFLTVTIAGLGISQLSHNALWGSEPVAGAENRGVTEEVYEKYVELRTIHETIDGMAEIMHVTADEVMANPAMIDGNLEVAQLISDNFGATFEMVVYRLEEMMPNLVGQSIEDPTMILIMLHGLDDYLAEADMDTMTLGVQAAAEYLELEPIQLMSHLQLIIDSPGALTAASTATEIEEHALVGFINIQLAEAEFEFDQGIYFNLMNYLNLNIGIFLLMFAIGGVSFMFSCIFNLTRNSLALGAGLPIGFFIFNLMANTSPDFENLRFFSLNTLYNPSQIVGGYEFLPQLATLALIGLALYSTGIVLFKRKDLPL